MGLEQTIQSDFAVGMQTDVARHLIDRRGSWLIANGLLNDDGLIYLRGCSRHKSNSAFGSSGRWAWHGWLHPGERTVFASPEDFGVLDIDDASPLNLGGAGLTLPSPGRLIDDLLFLPNDAGIYGGSRKETDYSTGTVNLVSGSKAVVGVGTAWAANVDPGMLLRHGTGERVYVVEAVADNTHLTLRDAYEGASTGAGAAYSLKRIEAVSAPYKSARIKGVAGGRLLWVEQNNIVGFTARGKPHSVDPNDTHEIEDGVDILAIEGIDNDAIIFTTQGYRVIRNVVLELVDALGALQQRLETPNRDLVLWGAAGIASYRGLLVVPAVDDVYLVDGISPPAAIGSSILPSYREHVELGNRPGGAAIYRNHYLLPILDLLGNWQDTLVCRLDRPVTTRSQRYFPWTFARNSGAEMSAYAVVPPVADGDAPNLIGVDNKWRGTYASDDFSIDTITPGIWAADAGAGTIAVAGGKLVPSSNAAKRFYRTDGHTYGDFDFSLKLHVGAALANGIAAGFYKRIGANDYLYGRLTRLAGAPNLELRKVVAGVDTQIAVSAVGALVAATDYWVRFVLEDDVVRIEQWAVEPVGTAAAIASLSHALSVSEIAAFGSEIYGAGGWMLIPNGNDWTIDDVKLGVSRARVVECSRYFEPGLDLAFDHDGTVRDLEWITRDFATGAGNSINRVRRARLAGYELIAADNTLPFITCEIAPGTKEALEVALWDEENWDEFDWSDPDAAAWRLLEGFAYADDGRNGFDWFTAERCRYARFRFRTSGPIAKLTIPSFEMFAAVGGGVRHTRVET